MGVIIIREMVGTQPALLERRRAPGRRDRLEDRAQHPDGRGREVDRRVEDGEIVEYRVELKIGFEYEG